MPKFHPALRLSSFYRVMKNALKTMRSEALAEQRFTISVSDEAIDDLRRRLRETRWPDTVTGSGWTYGLDLDWMKSIADYWLNQFDWRAQERTLNAFPERVADI